MPQTSSSSSSGRVLCRSSSQKPLRAFVARAARAVAALRVAVPFVDLSSGRLSFKSNFYVLYHISIKMSYKYV